MDVMSLLSIKKSSAPPDLYKKIKDEILRIHAPRKQDTYKKALSRVLTGLPSQLGQELINDICDKDVKLVGCCCAKAVFCLWSIQLPLTVRSQISNLTFDHATYQQVFQTADNIYLSTKVTEVSASVAAVGLKPEQVEDTPTVAAVRTGQRSNRNNKNKNQNNGSGTQAGGSNGGSNGNKNSNSNSGSGSSQGRRGPRHSSNPPSSCCNNHYKWGASAWFCLQPLTCPWVQKCGARPPKEENKN